MIPRQRRRSDGTTEPVALHDSALRVLGMLAAFTPENIQPTRAHGAFVERVRDTERLPKYLAKMGLELASSLSKLGSEGTDGIMHFGLWEVARLACAHGHPLRVPARKAWRALFRATFGTQTITFSDREALGLPEDPYAEGAEPPEADPGSAERPAETTSVIGEIQSTVYRVLAGEREHGLLSELHDAYGRGELGALPYVEAPGEAGRLLHRIPSSRGPPSTADPCALGADGFLLQRPDGSRCEVPSVAERLAQVEAGSTTIVGAAYREATALPSSGPSFVEQIRKRLAELIGKKP
jgi:hypothetical protein